MQSVNINGKTIYLTAKAGTFQVRDENNEPIALMGHTYYAKDSKSRNNRRPIVFAYNGGPGSSSFWLHMGVLGPKRIVVKDPESTPGAPYKLLNNNFSILDVADLVMIDPVGTGLSVPIGKAKFKDFGIVYAGEKKSHIFKFTNAGNAALVIERITGEKCLDIVWPDYPILPGQSGEITLTYDSVNRKGEDELTLNIVANTERRIHTTRLRAFVQ